MFIYSIVTWKSFENPNEFVCAFYNYLFVLNQPKPNEIKVKATKCFVVPPNTVKILQPKDFMTEYFSINRFENFQISKIIAKDDKIEKMLSKNVDYFKVRLLNQDVVENVFSFICSANNNAKRISTMVQFLANEYGPKIGEYRGENFHSFPEIEDLKSLDGGKLLQSLIENKFGYRSQRISDAINYISENGSRAFLESFKSIDYKQAHTNLCKIPGIGAKVADCICLMSMGKNNAVPIDTHMLQVAKRDYNFVQKAKSFTPLQYRLVQKIYQDIWGEYAGVVQLFVFAEDLLSADNAMKANKRKSQ